MVRVVLLLAAMLVLGPVQPRAAETITSDTVDYCTALATRVAQGTMPPNAVVLLAEGRVMCERGHVMGGLRRIRLAMLMTREPAAPYPNATLAKP